MGRVMRYYGVWLALGGALATTPQVLAQTQTQVQTGNVRYGAEPDWVLPPPASTATPSPDGAPVRVDYSDQQVRIGKDSDDSYIHYRMKLLTPQALAAGNLSVSWQPAAGGVTVHRLNIVRDGTVIDVLQSSKFTVLRRENNLDSAMLDGLLTAVLQTPGLQVGDELEFALSIDGRDPTLRDRSFGIVGLPSTGVLGAYRLRLLWPQDRKLRWQASPDVGKLREANSGGMRELIYSLSDPDSELPVTGAPLRYNIRRIVEYSNFASWSDLSRQFAPLYDAAATLPAASPIRAEAQKIADATADPAARAEAALQFVQDRIRYVYVGLNGGNLRPATAEETWERRFGDCKAKTVLLLALLRELGIAARPALVHSGGGDGMDERLPSPASFDHVLVEATIGGKPYWLDGTGAGDKYLDALPDPVFRWALPLTAGGSDLVRVPAVAPGRPQLVNIMTIDARQKFDGPVPITTKAVIRGSDAQVMRAGLAAMSAADAERALKEYWSSTYTEVTAGSARWRYDDRNAALVIEASGLGEVDWSGKIEGDRDLSLPGAGFYLPDKFERPKEQNQTAPWSVEGFPRFRCWATTVRLPPETSRWQWDYFSLPVEVRTGGVAYWRVGDLRDDVMRTVMSRRTLTDEITPAEAGKHNVAVRDFNNKMSRVYQIAADDIRAAINRPTAPFSEDTDWVGAASPCFGPEPKAEGAARRAPPGP
jgi:transglutaminase-like putative cysteine protease